MSRGFLVDTNVLSELMRPTPAPEVLAWFAQQAQSLIQTSAITQAEVLSGIALLPPGQRRDGLALAAEQLFEHDLAGRCLVFGSAAAKQYALVVAQRQRAGRPMATEDAQIAAIALAADLHLVTRNTKDFIDIPDLTVVNPWQTH